MPETDPSTQAISLRDTEGNEILLHHYNCLMRLFFDEQYNHVEMYDEEEDKTKGLMVGQAVMDLMFEMEFSCRYDYKPDEATVEWFIKSEVMIMESEIEELE